MAEAAVRYLVFDVESVADGNLVSRLKYPDEGLSPEEAVNRFRAELLEEKGSDFIPYTYQMPVSVAIAKLDIELNLIDQVVLDAPKFRPPVITDHFWRGWKAYRRPTFVTFNGRAFDIPLMELAAFRFGLSVPDWFNLNAKNFEQSRYRYNNDSHFDLYDVLTNYGASRFTGGLNLAANLLGKPGKMEIEGHMVQDLYHEGKLEEINEYCRCDVLDTYFVFLRCCVMLGKITLDREQELIQQTKTWLEKRTTETPIYQTYLDGWGDWENPWDSDAGE
ncbi:3'-5' exonuclease [Bremerella sp.]|uniref:3'-5' exonuclease n=1 Tax=Bremerella sp. TaxID=2795602 RepID=UPI00391DC26F